MIGFLPGKSRPGEIVIFSAHYDHIGVTGDESADSIYNGANDNATGVTAVIMLAQHYGRLNNNERSILFVCFSAEEMGLIGSSYFVDKIEPEKVVAVFNIEMIGTRSPWGKNSGYIVGYDVSSLGRIIRKNAALSGFTFRPDPFPKQNLFGRSDHFSFVKRGIPAITIMSARLDTDPHYHKVSDEVKTLDLENMARIIEGIGQATKSLISGIDTPKK
jgi:Zn-dependent M28 family amino/carboxypeptidase